MDKVRMDGTVKFFDQARFFGFLTAEDGKDYFFHGSDFDGLPAELGGGEKVSFGLGQDGKTGREKAECVQLIEE